MQVVILAGGLSSRMGGKSKSLTAVKGKPFVEHQLELYKQHRLLFLLGHQGSNVEAVVRCLRSDAQFSYDGNKLLGTGGALRNAYAKLENQFWLVYGDSYVRRDYNQQLPLHKLGLMSLYKNSGNWVPSNVEYDGENLRYDKAGCGDYVDAGATLLSKNTCFWLPANRSELSTLFNLLSTPPNQLAGEVIADRFYEVGSPLGLADFEEYVCKREAL